MAEAADPREQEDCPSGDTCDWSCDQHERPLTGMDERLAQVAEVLDRIHFDGNGCGTHGDNACSNCCGPSPMTALEIARALATRLSQWQAEDKAAERERIAQAIEAEPLMRSNEWHDGYARGIERAARIAREGGEQRG